MARLRLTPLARRPRPARTDPWLRVRGGLALLGLVIVVKVGDCRVLELDWFDALSQTVITVTTVGYVVARTNPQPSEPTF